MTKQTQLGLMAGAIRATSWFRGCSGTFLRFAAGTAALMLFLPAAVSADHWKADFRAAERESQETGVPLLIHFHAEWCGPCRNMERDVLSSVQITSRLNRTLIGVKVNTDHHKDLVRRFGISTLPSDVLLSPTGSVLAKTSGVTGLLTYAAMLNRHEKKIDIDAIAGRQSSDHEPAASQSHPDVKETIRPPIPSSLLQTLRATRAESPALRGYCPVELAETAQWVEGRHEFVVEHAGVQYFMSSLKSRDRFVSDPERFIPALRGFDTVALQNEERVICGKVEIGATYKSRIFLFATEENRTLFLERPDRFIPPPIPPEIKVTVDFIETDPALTRTETPNLGVFTPTHVVTGSAQRREAFLSPVSAGKGW
ncbi:MAG: thioredoxin family protein [Planctomycetaceae bacterium]|nr:thioredoxin family protein [Planctomycetaceae bacterium]